MHHPCSRTLTGFAALAALTALTTSVTLAEEGSELPDGSVVIDSFPFIATGDTSDNLDDFDAVCPWKSDAPDVFYSYTVQHPSAACDGGKYLTLQLCESSYDTKVFVLDEAFNVIACNDDFCSSSGGGGFRSTLFWFPVGLGRTVHIGIDGWSGDSGVYELEIWGKDSYQFCVLDLDGTTPEIEPCRETEEDAALNDGCDSPGAPSFESVNCGEMRSGTISSGDFFRDTDWYELTSEHAYDVTVGGTAEFTLVVGRIDDGTCVPGVPQCSCIGTDIAPISTTNTCGCASVTSPVVAGRSWWYVSTVKVGALPCIDAIDYGNDYRIAFECVSPACCGLGDANGDHEMTFDDLLVMLLNWGDCHTGACCAQGDATGDGTIGIADIVVLLANWGSCG